MKQSELGFSNHTCRPWGKTIKKRATPCDAGLTKLRSGLGLKFKRCKYHVVKNRKLGRRISYLQRWTVWNCNTTQNIEIINVNLRYSKFPVGKIGEKAVCRSVFFEDTALYMLSDELSKTHSFRLFFADFSHWVY